MGIYISADKDYLLERKLERLLVWGQYESISALYRMLKNNQGSTMEDLIHHITTTHTFFFRENKHLSILRKDILDKKLSKPLIWVAACSTGEEVYSIIIELLEHDIQNFSIIASDINSEVLHHCKRGVYSRDRMREIREPVIKKYFDPVPNSRELYRVKHFLKDYFIVKHLNLMDKLKFEQEFDYIFCRNVLIYFNHDSQRRVLEVLLRNLKDNGYLFVGHSESLMHLTNTVQAIHSSVYCKRP